MVSYKTIKTVFSQGVTCKEAEIGNQEGKLDNCFPEKFTCIIFDFQNKVM